MTPKQRAEVERLRGRVRILEQRNRALSGAFSKVAMDRFAWFVNEIEDVCEQPHARRLIRVSRSDARLLRPILEALVQPPEVRRRR